MTESEKSTLDKTRIVEQIAELSRLLGMIPVDDTIAVQEPVGQTSMPLSEWFREARSSFLKLSLLLGRSLDLDLQ